MDINEEIRELVIARLQTLPDDKGISIGSAGEFSKDEMISHVAAGDSVGQRIIEIEMNFLRTLKEGEFFTDTYAFADAA